MDNLPKVSIVIPAYLRAEQTKKTLLNLYESTGWNSGFIPEVIVADSSPDDSVKNILPELKNPVPFYIRPKISGIAANKNAGAGNSRNEILIFCDSDMEVEPDALIHTLSCLLDHPQVAMVGGKVIWKGSGKEGQLDRPRKEDRMQTVNGTCFTEVIYSRFMATYRSLFFQIGGYDEELFNMRGEGSDLSIRYWRSGLPLAFDEKIIVHHVYDAPQTATRHIEHPERGIIRDLIQLGYKYGLSRDESPNFAKTLQWLTDEFGERDKYIIIESIVSLLPYFWENREKVEKCTSKIPLEYDFKFLDIFTKNSEFLECVQKAEERIREAREKAFRK